MVSSEAILTIPVYFIMIWTAINFLDWFRIKLSNIVVPFESKDRELLGTIKTMLSDLHESMKRQDRTAELQGMMKDQLQIIVEQQMETLNNNRPIDIVESVA